MRTYLAFKGRSFLWLGMNMSWLSNLPDCVPQVPDLHPFGWAVLVVKICIAALR